MSDPAAELEGYRAQRISGSLGESEYLGHVERLAPLIESGQSTQAPTSEQQAEAQLRELQQKRIAGTISDKEYREQADKLGPLSSGEVTASPVVEAELDLAMQPPNSPNDYRLDYTEAPSTPEAQAADASAREAMHEMGIPQTFAPSMHSTVERLARDLKDATPEQRQAHADGELAKLQQLWGDKYEANIETVMDFAAAAPGVLGDLIEAAPWVLADAVLLTQLHQLAAHHTKARA